VTDTTTTEVETPFIDVNPFNEYSLSRAWADGQRHKAQDLAFDTTTFADDENRQSAYKQGWDGLGVNKSEFDAPMPVKGDGVKVNITFISIDDKYVPFLYWAYDLYEDKADPKVRPRWMQLEVKDRGIALGDNDARSFVRTATGREGFGPIELPCPPYTYDVDGAQLTIIGGNFRKSGTKPEFEAFIEELQGEVEDMPEGEDVSDQYMRATGTVTVQFSVNIPITDILDGEENLTSDGLWMGDMDEMQERACTVFEEDMSEYITDDDLDMSYGFEDAYMSEAYVD